MMIMAKTERPGLRITLRATCGLLLALCTVSGGRAADPPPAGVFGATLEVRVVNVEVVVEDKSGIRVPNLTAKDFRLKVDGQEAPLDYFTEVRGGDAVAPTAAGAPGIPALAPGSPVGTSYLVFIDDFFSIERDRNRVLSHLQEEVARLGPEDRMAVVAYDGRKMEMLSSWSQSVPGLSRVLREAQARPAQGLQRLNELRSNDRDRRVRLSSGLDIDPMGGRTVTAQLNLSERAYAEQLADQVEGSIAAATATLRSFANPPGRKVALLLCGGWPFQPAEYAINDFRRPVIENSIPSGEKLFRKLSDTANLLGYTLYPVDVPGMQSQVADAAADAPPDPALAGLDSFTREQINEDSLTQLARETGGKALLNAGRDQALEQAAADTRSYYWLGFTPVRRGDDRRYDIKVEVLGPGLKVRFRRGFEDFSKRREVSMAVESALLFGNPPSNKPLQVVLGKPVSSGMGKVKLPLTVAIPVDGITLLQIAGAYTAELELRVAALDAAGRRSEIPVVAFTLTSKTPPQAGKVVRYDTTLELRKSRQEVVVAIYDKASGNLMSTTLEIEP